MNKADRELVVNARFVINVVLGLLAATGASSASGQVRPTTQPSLEAQNAVLQQKVDALEAKVDKLEKAQTQPSAPSAAEMTAAVDQVIHQADEQSQLFAVQPMTSGYDPTRGFVLRSDNGDFSLRPGIVLDFRYIANYRQSIPHGGGGETDATGDNTQSGFNVTRMRLTLAGNYTRNVAYFVQFQDDEGQGVGLLDAYITYRFGDDSPFYARVGQFKDPLWHERNLSEANLLAVDRSLAEYLLGGGQTSRVQGAALIYDQDRLRLQGVIHDGFNSINSKFYDTGGLGAGVGGGAGVTPTNYGVSGRAEYLVLGTRTPNDNPYRFYDNGFTALGYTQDIAVAGGGFDFSQAGANSVLFHTADLQYDNTSGFSAYGAYLGAYRDLVHNQGVAPGNYYDPGVVVQAAYLVTPKLEPFVRYDYTYLASRSEAASLGVLNHQVQEFTIGANYYLYRQNVKFTVDASWLPDGAPTDSDALGVLKDSGQNEFVLRAQFQLAL